MTYTPPSSLLHGLSVERAQLYGMPHIGARYRGADANTHRLDEGAVCSVCGRPASNAHHEPPKGTCPYFALQTEWGMFMLKPALIALCGSGTTGCHGGRHQGLVTFRWEWFEDSSAEAWWSGWLLSHGYEPHDPRLYELGQWRVTTEDGTATRSAAFQERHR